MLSGESPSTENDDKNTTEVTKTVPYEEKTASDMFIYEVKMEDGTIKSFIDRDELNKFMEENKDINFILEI